MKLVQSPTHVYSYCCSSHQWRLYVVVSEERLISSESVCGKAVGTHIGERRLMRERVEMVRQRLNGGLRDG